MYTLKSSGDLIPILIKCQQLQKRLLEDEAGFALSWNWVDAFLRVERGFDSPTYAMLRQAMMARRALLLLDGIDEGGIARKRIERHVTQVLAPQGHVLLCSSRPTGLDEDRFALFHRLRMVPLPCYPPDHYPPCALCAGFINPWFVRQVPLSDLQQAEVVSRRLGVEGAAQMQGYLEEKVPLDMESAQRVTSNPLMLSMVISTFELCRGVAMPDTVAELYASAASAMLHRAGAHLERDLQALLEASFFEAHASQRRVIEQQHLEAAALQLTNPARLASIRQVWPDFSGHPHKGHYVSMAGGRRGIVTSEDFTSERKVKVTLSDGTVTGWTQACQVSSSGLSAQEFETSYGELAQRRMVKAALEALPDSRLPEAVQMVCERVRQDCLPLMSLLQAEPLQMQASHISFQEFHFAKAVCRGSFQLPIAAMPWRWPAWWTNAFRFGSEMGNAFCDGLSAAAAVGESLNLSGAISGYRPTSVAALAAMLRGSSALKQVPASSPCPPLFSFTHSRLPM